MRRPRIDLPPREFSAEEIEECRRKEAIRKEKRRENNANHRMALANGFVSDRAKIRREIAGMTEEQKKERSNNLKVAKRLERDKAELLEARSGTGETEEQVLARHAARKKRPLAPDPAFALSRSELAALSEEQRQERTRDMKKSRFAAKRAELEAGGYIATKKPLESLEYSEAIIARSAALNVIRNQAWRDRNKAMMGSDEQMATRSDAHIGSPYAVSIDRPSSSRSRPAALVQFKLDPQASFRTHRDATVLLDEKARLSGFSIVNAQGDIVRGTMTLTCYRFGNHVAKSGMTSSEAARAQKSYKTGCSYVLRVKRRDVGGEDRWIVTEQIGKHNHQMDHPSDIPARRRTAADAERDIEAHKHRLDGRYTKSDSRGVERSNGGHIDASRARAGSGHFEFQRDADVRIERGDTGGEDQDMLDVEASLI